MNVAVTPQTIPIPWVDYLKRSFDRSIIPWKQFRYSGTGVVEMTTEVYRNNEIALNFRDLIIRDVKKAKGKVFINGIGIEVARSEKEERVPDMVVLSKEMVALFNDEIHVITRDMPDPILVVEVLSPSSVKDDLEVKSMEYLDRGVREYVAIDWRSETVTVWSRRLNSYSFVDYKLGDRVDLLTFPKLDVTVDELILKDE